VEQAAFDDITYRKGRAVIRMLENYLGADDFRDGVRAYMKRYKYGNTRTDDLWDALEKASGKNVKDIANAFTTKPGVPLITVDKVTPGNAATVLTLKQGRYAVDDSAEEKTAWPVPVYAAEAGPNKPSVLQFVEGDKPVDMTIAGRPPIKVNVGQTVYCRTHHGAAFADLIGQLDTLDPADQLGLLFDCWALG